MTEKARILIVDDVPANIKVLAEGLKGLYKVSFASTGEDAIDTARGQNPPDLILLDVIMPGMDGFEVCKIIKKDPVTENIPIIFISAKDDAADETHGFEVGAIDYIVKPFSMPIVQARVATHIELKRHRDEEVKKIQEQLIEQEKLAALGGVVAGFTHEINTPIGIANTAADHLKVQTDEIVEKYESGKMKRSDLDEYVRNAKESASLVVNNIKNATALIRSFKQTAVDQSSNQTREFSFSEYLNEILLSLRPQLKKTAHKVEVNCSNELIVEGIPGAFCQIFTNLILNSLIHAFEGIGQGTMTIDITNTSSVLRIDYRDNGNGVPEEVREKIFDNFFTTKRGQGGSGIGMHIVFNLITNVMGGEVVCNSAKGEGIHFHIDIPGEVKNTVFVIDTVSEH